MTEEALMLIAQDQDLGTEAELAMEVALLKEQLARAERRVEELTALADRDPLVGVLNPRAFTREVARAIAGSARHGHVASLVSIDIDGLKTINMKHGRAAGDAALAHVGRVVSAHVRTTDAVGRMRGGEFSILLAFADGKSAQGKMARLAAKIAETPLVLRDGSDIAVSVRFSVAEVCAKLGASEQITQLGMTLHEEKAAA